MKLIADESVDGPVVARLRADGHEVVSIAEDSPSETDAAILSGAYDAGLLVLTSDKDFGELVFRDRQPHAGVLLLRLAELDRAALCDRVSWAFAQHGPEFPGAFSVLKARTIRIGTEPGD